MAGTQPQYNFPPPPPPPTGPPSSNYPQQYPQHGYAQGPPRGGGNVRGGGRGGGPGGRGDFHNPSYPQHGNGYNGPPAGYNGQQNGGYAGPQAHSPQGGPGNAPYPGPGPQWQQQQHDPRGPHQHGPQYPQQAHMHHAPVPAPLSRDNYHPNFAPLPQNGAQNGQQPQQYGPQQPPNHQQQFQHGPQQPPYGHNAPHASQGGPPAQQWSGPQSHPNPQLNGRGRGGSPVARGGGGFGGSRGGYEAPLAGPPMRMGFGNGQEQMAQAGNGFPPSYPNGQQSPPAPFPASAIQNYQPPPQNYYQGGQHPPTDFYGPNRGRGNNMNMNFRGRGRGDFGRGDFQFRGGQNNRFQNGPQRPEMYKPAGADAMGKKKKKRRTNTLGLTPNGDEHEESEDEVDDVDEEVKLVTLLGPDTPQLPTDLGAWLAERKARYPTKARRDAVAQEHLARDSKIKQESSTKIKAEEGESKLEKQQRKAEKLRLELEKAERRIQNSMSGSKRKRETGDEGDEERGEVSEEESAASDSGSDGPEAMSSRTVPPAPTPASVSQQSKAQLQRHCKYFSTGGTCGKKGKCRFVHDQEVRNQALRDKENNGGKMTLAQRLILNDTAKDDLTILKSIKYLKEKGLMADQPRAVSPEDDLMGSPNQGNGYADQIHYD